MKNSIPTRINKFHQTTGYTLAFKRASIVSRSERNKLICSIKYPLIYSGSTAELYEKIKLDYNKLFGRLNYSQDVNYSLIDFWFDSIKCGVIFQPSAAKLSGFVASSLAITHKHSNVTVADFAVKVKAQLRVSSFESLEKLTRRLSGLFDTANPQHSEILHNLTDKMWHTYNNVGKSDELKKQVLVEFFNLTSSVFDKETTFTFYIHSKLNDLSTLSRADFFKVLIEEREKILGDRNQKNFESPLESILGLDNNFTALSNYFGDVFRRLQLGETTGILKEMLSISSMWVGNEQELEKRLIFLSQRAKHLGNPLLVNTWADYRSHFGSKLSSWLSNIFRIRDEQSERYEGYLKDFELLSNINFIDDGLRGDAGDLVNSIGSKHYELVNKLLPDFRSHLNQYFQENKQLFKVNDEQTFSDRFKNLTKPTPKVPSFFGMTKGDAFEDFSQARVRIDDYLKILDILDSSVFKSFDSSSWADTDVKKFLQKLNDSYNKANTVVFKSFVSLIFKDLNLELLDFNSGRAYFLTGYERRKRKEIDITSHIPDIKAYFSGKFSSVYSDFKVALESEHWQESIDWLELLKIVTAYRIKTVAYPLDLPMVKTNNKEISELLELKKNKFSERDLSKLANTFIFSDLRGIISRLSSTKFIERFVLLTEGSLDDFQLLSDKASGHNQKFFVVIKDGTQTTHNLPRFDKSTQCFIENKSSKGTLFDIRSSKYQIRFLRMLSNKFKRTQDIYISLNNPTLILEHEYFPKTKDVRNERLFVTMPFTIQSDESEKLAFSGKLGVDLGEYGLAYAVVTKIPSGFSIDLNKVGFIYSDELRSLSSEVSSLKARQVSGTFMMASSKLARLRESASHSLRNRVQEVALRNNAQLVFEFSVDAFETAGNRVKKLYATIKQGNVYKDTDVAKSDYSKYWGKYDKTKPYGVEVGSYATSYICPKCRNSVYQIEDSEEFELTKLSEYSNLYIAKSAKNNVYVYSEKSIAGRLNGKETRKLSKMFARPPYGSESVSLAKSKGWLPDTFEPSDDFCKTRGSQAIFICPFSCGGVFDADVQAAVNIAIKSYLRDTKAVERNPAVPLELSKSVEKKPILDNADYLKLVKEIGDYPSVRLL